MTAQVTHTPSALLFRKEEVLQSSADWVKTEYKIMTRWRWRETDAAAKIAKMHTSVVHSSSGQREKKLFDVSEMCKSFLFVNYICVCVCVGLGIEQ